MTKTKLDSTYVATATAESLAK